MSGKMSVEKIKKKLAENSQCFTQQREIVVTDDWYPCYPGNKIIVSIMFYAFPQRAPIVKMTAWGMDDTGYEIEFQCGNHDFSYEACYSVYKQWKQNVFDKIPDGIDMQWFREHCFYPA